MKRFFYIIMVLIMLAGSAYSFGDTAGPELGISEVKEMAANNSRQAALDDLEIKSLKSALEKALKDAKMTPDAYGPYSVLNNKIVREVRPIEAQTALEAAEKRKLDKLNILKNNVEKTFLEILLVREELELEIFKLGILNKRHLILEKKYEEDLITINELEDMQYTIESKKFDIAAARAKLDSLDMKLKNHLDLSLGGEPVDISGKIVYKPYNTVAMDNIINRAMENSTDIYVRQMEVKAKDKNMEITASYYKEGGTIYDTADFNLEMAKSELENSKTSLEVNIKNTYNNLLDKMGKVELALKYEEIAKKKLDIAKIKYENGLISMEQLLKEEQDLRQAEYQTLKSVFDYNMTRIDFEVFWH